MQRARLSHWRLLFWSVLFLVPVRSHADPISLFYYVNASGQIETTVPTTTLGGGGTYDANFNTGKIQQSFYALAPSLSNSDSVTAADPAEGGALYTASSQANIY
jgi:hypothetical protein